jgi:hypothetical protein
VEVERFVIQRCLGQRRWEARRHYRPAAAAEEEEEQ